MVGYTYNPVSDCTILFGSVPFLSGTSLSVASVIKGVSPISGWLVGCTLAVFFPLPLFSLSLSEGELRPPLLGLWFSVVCDSLWETNGERKGV